MSTYHLFCIVCAVTILIMLIYYVRRRKRLVSAFFGMFSGLLTLILMNKFGGAIGGYLPLNLFNVCGSMVLGIPFVALLIIIKYL